MNLLGENEHEFRVDRELINTHVRMIDVVIRVIDGQPWPVAVYTCGIADGARLGYIPERYSNWNVDPIGANSQEAN